MADSDPISRRVEAAISFIDEELAADAPAIRWDTEQALREIRELLRPSSDKPLRCAMCRQEV